MTDLEDRLRALRGLDAPHGGAVESLRRRIRHRRARRVAGASVVTVVVALCSIALWPAGDHSARVDVIDDVTTSTGAAVTSMSTTSAASTTSTTTAPAPAGAIVLPTGAALGPGELAVSRFLPGNQEPGTNELSIISAIDGSIVRTLDTVGTSEGGILDIAISADRRTILATRGTSACTGELVAYAADGTGEPVVYTQFKNPLLLDRSPDGTSIAVSADDDCDGLQTITVWPVGGATEPLAVFGDGGVAGGGLVTDPGGSRPGGGEPGDPYVTSLSFADPETLDVIVDSVGARRIDLVTGSSSDLALGNANYLGFTSTDGTARLALVQSDTGPEFGVETDAGTEQNIALDETPLDIASIGGEQVWVTPDRRLFRLLEVNVVALRDDVTAVA